MKTIIAGVLNVAYLEAGPPDGFPVILLHGFPYDVQSYAAVSERLSAAGLRCIVPYLRGYGLTHFLAADTPRSGQQAGLGADLLAFMDALHIPNALLGGLIGAVEPHASSPHSGRNGSKAWSAAAPDTTSKTSPKQATQLHPKTSTGIGINIIFIANGAAQDFHKTGKNFAACSGSCGHHYGSSMMPLSFAAPPRSKIRILWILSSIPIVIASEVSRAIQLWTPSSSVWQLSRT